jgi:DNA-3-methyladenine glycosylase
MNKDQLLKKISSDIYQKNPFDLVQHTILGAYLCTMIDGQLTAIKITEAEVYIGGIDKAAHTYQFRKTNRTAIQFKEGGYAYTFLVYGMHHQFCITTSPAGQPDTILIRSGEPIIGIDCMQKRRKKSSLKNLTNGPGKLCQALGITKQHNAESLTGDTIWLSPRQEKIRSNDIIQTPRIGIDYADEYRDKPWRFILKDSPYLSHP